MIDMPKFEVIDPKPYHCSLMARLLRDRHRDLLEKAGTNAHRTLRDSFDNSSYRRMLLIDGKVGILGGVVGPAISSTGYLWVAISDEAKKYPVTLVRVIKREMAVIASTRLELTALVIFGDEKAQRFATFLGFDFSKEPQPATAHAAFLMTYRPGGSRPWPIQ